MIKLMLSGGLGNQMFQYAFARSLEIETKNKLILYIDSYKSDCWERHYSLGELSLPDDIQVRNFSKIEYLFYKGLKFIYYRLKWMKYVKKHYIVTANEYDYYKINNADIGSLLYADRNFQSYKWFEINSAVIKKEMLVKAPIAPNNVKLIEAMKNSNSVCVHIRRGDYLNPCWNHLNVCDYAYYAQSMKYISENTEAPVFYIFSNSHEDIEWIKQNYDFSKYHVYYVDENNPDYEELRLMYSCKHFIISNSTFSWWAQYLSDNPCKIVCAPSEWNRNYTNKEQIRENLYMEHWHIIMV